MASMSTQLSLHHLVLTKPSPYNKNNNNSTNPPLYADHIFFKQPFSQPEPLGNADPGRYHSHRRYDGIYSCIDSLLFCSRQATSSFIVMFFALFWIWGFILFNRVIIHKQPPGSSLYWFIGFAMILCVFYIPWVLVCNRLFCTPCYMISRLQYEKEKKKMKELSLNTHDLTHIFRFKPKTGSFNANAPIVESILAYFDLPSFSSPIAKLRSLMLLESTPSSLKGGYFENEIENGNISDRDLVQRSTYYYNNAMTLDELESQIINNHPIHGNNTPQQSIKRSPTTITSSLLSSPRATLANASTGVNGYNHFDDVEDQPHSTSQQPHHPQVDSQSIRAALNTIAQSSGAQDTIDMIFKRKKLALSTITTTLHNLTTPHHQQSPPSLTALPSHGQIITYTDQLHYCIRLETYREMNLHSGILNLPTPIPQNSYPLDNLTNISPQGNNINNHPNPSPLGSRDHNYTSPSSSIDSNRGYGDRFPDHLPLNATVFTATRIIPSSSQQQNQYISSNNTSSQQQRRPIWRIPNRDEDVCDLTNNYRPRMVSHVEDFYIPISHVVDKSPLSPYEFVRLIEKYCQQDLAIVHIRDTIKPVLLPVGGRRLGDTRTSQSVGNTNSDSSIQPSPTNTTPDSDLTGPETVHDEATSVQLDSDSAQQMSTPQHSSTTTDHNDNAVISPTVPTASTTQTPSTSLASSSDSTSPTSSPPPARPPPRVRRNVNNNNNNHHRRSQINNNQLPTGTTTTITPRHSTLITSPTRPTFFPPTLDGIPLSPVTRAIDDIMAAIGEQWANQFDPHCHAWRVIGFHFYGAVPPSTILPPSPQSLSPSLQSTQSTLSFNDGVKMVVNDHRDVGNGNEGSLVFVENHRHQSSSSSSSSPSPNNNNSNDLLTTTTLHNIKTMNMVHFVQGQDGLHNITGNHNTIPNNNDSPTHHSNNNNNTSINNSNNTPSSVNNTISNPYGEYSYQRYFNNITNDVNQLTHSNNHNNNLHRQQVNINHQPVIPRRLRYPTKYQTSMETYLEGQSKRLVGQECGMIRVKDAVECYQEIYQNFNILSTQDVQQTQNQTQNHQQWLERPFRFHTNSHPESSWFSKLINSIISTLYRFCLFGNPLLYLLWVILGFLPCVNCLWRYQTREIKYDNHIMVYLPNEYELATLIVNDRLNRRCVYRNDFLTRQLPYHHVQAILHGRG